MQSFTYLSSKYYWPNCWARFRESLIDLLLKVESRAICVFAQQIQENQPEKHEKTVLLKIVCFPLDGNVSCSCSPFLAIEYFYENFYVECFHFILFVNPQRWCTPFNYSFACNFWILFLHKIDLVHTMSDYVVMKGDLSL